MPGERVESPWQRGVMAASEVPPSGHFKLLFAMFLTGLSTRGTPDSIAAMQSSIALSGDIAAFIQSGISMTLASRDDRFVPSIAKGVGCRVSPGRDAVIVLVFANTAEALLRDVAHSRQLAAVFSQPSTNRTLQIKGATLRPRPPALPTWRSRAASSPSLPRSCVRWAGVLTSFTTSSGTTPCNWWPCASRPSRPSTRRPGPGAGAPLGSGAVMRARPAGHPRLLRGRDPGRDGHLRQPTARPTSPTSRRCSTSTSATSRCRSSSSTRRGRTSWPIRTPRCWCCIR